MLALACDVNHHVVVRVELPGLDGASGPERGVGLVALPYDRDSLLRSMAAARNIPRPDVATAALDSVFARYKGPFVTYARAVYEATRLADSVDRVRKRLGEAGSGSEAARVLQGQLASLEARAREAAAARDRVKAPLEAARAALAKAEPLRGALRRWEDSSYKGYDSVTKAITLGMGRDPVADTTDARGYADFTLSPGQWWIYARSWDATDPNNEWYWNLRVPEKGDTMRLDATNAQRRPRY